MIDYDYIILGCGASGLSLINKMIKDSYFSNKSILIIDKEKKDSNDKTWCYWEDGKGEWDDILTVKWDKISFINKSFDKREVMTKPSFGSGVSNLNFCVYFDINLLMMLILILLMMMIMVTIIIILLMMTMNVTNKTIAFDNLS